MPATKTQLSPDALPPYLRALWTTLPPRLKVKAACDLRQVGRAELYNKIDRGEVVAYKSRSTTLIDTLSILLDLANLPAFADAKVLPPNKRGKRTTVVADDTTTSPKPRRGRRKGEPDVVNTSSDTATATASTSQSTRVL